MKKMFILVLLLIGFISSCTPDQKEIETWKKEIADTEHAFASMAKTEGISKAFTTFAADGAVLLRNNNLVKGKEAIKKSYEKRLPSGTVSLTGTPDFVDVSASGDLGYTYGKYVYTSTDSLGNIQSNEGIFHTVWKRQRDGSWKFVWD